MSAERFAAALREQRAMKLTGGIYHLTQVQLAFNTNRIEGSRLSEDQTRFIYETRTVTGDAPVDDVIETVNHFRAFDAMIDHVGQPITADTLKEYHRLLRSGTSDAEKEWFAVGDWKRVKNEVGGMATSPPEDVGADIDALLAEAPAQMTFEDVTDFHVRFEQIHPFQDGNGRVGRLVMFEQTLASGIMPFVVLDAEKHYYYRGLSEYDSEPGFLRETFRHFQDAYYARYASFVPRAPAPEPLRAAPSTRRPADPHTGPITGGPAASGGPDIS
ncbi:Fic family protein [Microbacterium karelineae]|uniref:Fic family protein n=1 Tax=Microbacterium karelineae TaxID=2654283 RepID=UPI0018D2B93D|nr:Fic family protein [Microbacterium karelineae]